MAGKGGKRPGAGRKPSTLKGVLKKLPSETAELILAEIKANEKWVHLANSDDERIVLDTLKYLTDRAYGKAAQVVIPQGEGGGVPTFKVLIEHIGTATTINPASA